MLCVQVKATPASKLMERAQTVSIAEANSFRGVFFEVCFLIGIASFFVLHGSDISL
jgi:hypothetical protein